MRNSKDLSRLSTSRRRLLLSGGLAGGSAALAGVPANGSAEVDVCVIGAGISGLTTAYRLAQRGVSVKVVEAKNRVGGRTLNQDIGGGNVVEMGGQWWGPTQVRVLALARELGIGTFLTYTQGQAVNIIEGQRYLGDSYLTTADTVQFLQVSQAMEELAKQVPLDKPWLAPRAEEWDRLTLAQWLKERVTAPGAYAQFEVLCLGTRAALPQQVSFLHWLAFLGAAGGVTQLAVGAQTGRFIGGSQAISLELARRLGPAVVLDSPVREIDQTDPAWVQVRSDLVTVRARQVIISLSPADCRTIQFRPDLPVPRISLQRNWPAGIGAKANVVYDRPFWRAAGLNGQGSVDRGVVGFTYDNSPPSGTPGVIVVFVSTEKIEDETLLKDAVIRGLVALFGPQAATPIGYYLQDWARVPFTFGCESPLGTGFTTLYRDTAVRPVDRVRWTGTETASIWTGYMEGAVRSGEAAAASLSIR